MTDAERERFDGLMQDAIDAMPPKLHALIDEVPIVLLDRPTPAMIKDLIADGTLLPEDEPTAGDELCGLHSGIAITDRSIDDPGGWGSVGQDTFGPERIHIFRDGIVNLATDDVGWSAEHADENIYEEILITILHEIGHHYGLDEDDLEELGYA
jgi:predicted Zn-dependent protease with MMP-like domain